jgi:WD40 repeat protein
VKAYCDHHTRVPPRIIRLIVLNCIFIGLSPSCIAHGQTSLQVGSGATISLETGHSDDVLALAFSRDGHWLASGSKDQSIKIWDVARGRVVRTLTGHTKEVTCVAFSPGSKRLASGSGDGTIRVWNASNGWTSSVLAGTGISIFSVVFSNDGERIISGDLDGLIKVRDASSGAEIRSIQDRGVVLSLAVAPGDDSLLASATEAVNARGENAAHLWNLKSGKEVHKVTGYSGAVSQVSFSPDGGVLATASFYDGFKLWDVKSGNELRTIKSATSSSALFMRDGRLLTSGVFTVNIWDVSNGTQVKHIDGPDGSVVALSADDKIVATAGNKGVRLWDTASGHELPVFSVPRDAAVGIAVSPSGRLLASVNFRLLEVWNLPEGGVKVFPTDPMAQIGDVRFSPDEKSLVTWGYTNTFTVWDVSSGQKRFTATGHKKKVNCVAFRSDGRILASASDDGTIRLWSASNGALLRTISAYLKSADSVAYEPDGEHLVSSGAERKEDIPTKFDDQYAIKLWDPKTGTLIRHFLNEGVPTPHEGLILSPAGHLCALFDLGYVWLVNGDTGRKILKLDGRQGFVTSISFSPDGRWIAAGSKDHTVKFWDVASGDEILTLTGHTDQIGELAFGPSRKWLATCANDGTIRIWDATRGTTIATLVSFRDGKDWIRITSDRFFDGSAGGEAQISVLGPAGTYEEALEKSRNPLALWNALSDLSVWNSPNLRQPITSGSLVSLELPPDIDPAEVKVRKLRLKIRVSARDGGNGVREVQLLQNGSAVRIWSRDLRPDRDGRLELQEDVYLEEGKSRFSAVAISSSGKKSAAKEVEVNAANLQPEMMVQTGHTATVYDVQFSPKESLLASAGGDRAVVLWDPVARRQLRRLLGHSGPVNCLAFSPDGRLLASASLDKTVMLWEVTTGRRLRTLAGHGDGVFAVAFSPNGRLLASGSKDYTVGLWDVISGREIHTLEGHKGPVSHVAFSPDGRILASAGLDKTIRLWDTETGRSLRTLVGHSMPVAALAFSPDGHVLVSGAQFGTIKFWDVTTGHNLCSWDRALKLDVPDDKKPFLLDDIAFSPDGRWVVTSEGLVLDAGTGIWMGVSDVPGAIRIFDSISGRELRRITNEVGVAFKGISFSADKKWLSWGDSKGGIQLSALALSRGEVHRLSGQAPSVASLDVSPRGNKLAIAGNNIHLWDLKSGRPAGVLDAGSANVAVISFGNSEKQLVSQDGDGMLNLWMPGSQNALKLGSKTTDTGSQAAIKFSPDGQFLASGANEEGAIRLWKTSTGKPVRTFGGLARHELLRTIDFSHDGRLLVSAGGGVLTFWDVGEGTELRTFDIGDSSNVSCAIFSPDDKSVATANSDGVIDLWDVATGNKRHLALKTSGSVNTLAFSPDGRWLASAGSDAAIRIWQVDNGQLLRTMTGHESSISAIAFLPADTPSHSYILVSGSSDATTRIWDTDSGELLATLLNVGSEADWLVTTPDGLFDGSPGGWSQVLWRFGGKTRDVEPVEIFFSEFFHPGLLAEIVEGKRPKAAIKLDKIDRRQPKVRLALTGGRRSDEPITSRTAGVTISVSEAAHGSGANDVRLFRNGSLVKTWHGSVKAGRATFETEVTMTAGENRLTAYAYNDQNIKSEDAGLTVKGADALIRKGTAYIIAVGVNHYENHNFDLNYAIADAQAFEQEVQQDQETLGAYEKVRVVSLLDEKATLKNILALCYRLAGTDFLLSSPDVSADLSDIGLAQPEDAIFIYFAGHGIADGNERFYMIPYDLGYMGARDNINEDVLATLRNHGISDLNLADAFEGIDAGRIVLVIDACDSGQALTSSEQESNGPSNSKGLAQLAYEKGMYILTAAKSFQAALEISQLNHGLLTFALVEEGLRQRKAADQDGRVYVRRWLDYAADEVPHLHSEWREGTLMRGFHIAQTTYLQTPRVFYRREPESEPFVIAPKQPQ